MIYFVLKGTQYQEPSMEEPNLSARRTVNGQVQSATIGDSGQRRQPLSYFTLLAELTPSSQKYTRSY